MIVVTSGTEEKEQAASGRESEGGGGAGGLRLYEERLRDQTEGLGVGLGPQTS